MDFKDYVPFPDKELGGGADYDDPTQIPMGLAPVCRNMRFRRRSVRTRDGYLHTMSYTIDPTVPATPPFDMTGVEALDVLVNNPQQLVVAFDTNGDLLQETPVGSGTMVPLSPPFPLPTGASMQTAKAYNRIYAATSNLLSALAPPLVIDGPTGVVSPVSQSPIGAIWTPGRNYLVGDVVRTSQNPSRWFRCILAGAAGNVEPTWPTLDGYLLQAPSVASIVSVRTYFAEEHPPQTLTIFTVSSTVGFNLRDSVTSAGVSLPALNGTGTITSIGTNTITTTAIGANGNTGTGGFLTDATGSGFISMAAEVTDPNGTSQWVEWTPGATQFILQPEAPEQVISVKGQAARPRDRSRPDSTSTFASPTRTRTAKASGPSRFFTPTASRPTSSKSSFSSKTKFQAPSSPQLTELRVMAGRACRSG